jgi:hypothetical protein
MKMHPIIGHNESETLLGIETPNCNPAAKSISYSYNNRVESFANFFVKADKCSVAAEKERGLAS